MCRRHHNIEEFATALRAVGEPIRGLPVKDISLGQMLDGLFKITRDFDMPTQPHLLLLQKTMVMEEGVATALDPDINMWETAEPFLSEWVRSELGPEARLADEIVRNVRTAAQAPRPDPPHRPLLSAARRRAARAAAARHRRGPAAPLLAATLLTALAVGRGWRRGRAAPKLRRMRGKRILLIVGGGIAAYKACELIRLIRKAGGSVRCVLTEGGAQFITPMTLAALVRAAGPYQPVGPQGRGRDGPYPARRARPTWSSSARPPPTCWRRWRRASPTISPPPCCSPPTSRCSPRRR